MQKSTLQLLRFHFSFFLLPVYLFALSRVVYTNWWRALLIFFILHLLVYPASNGYNSYMDRDETSIGGIKKPMAPTLELYIVTLIMDIAAIAISFFVSVYFALGILLYILASRGYSYRGIRLKKYPYIGYLTVVIFQGAVTFWLVYHGCHEPITFQVPPSGMLASSLLIGGFYPLTQVYQHEADAKDGVKSISSRLGYRGTFVFTAVVYLIAFIVLAYHFFVALDANKFFVLATCMLPILVYFFIWARKVWKDTAAASFSNTMRMNMLASVCTNIGFLILVIWKIVSN
ncbi:MAG: UbiA family prenyltransferase [Chitinophagaceae bacterium]